MTWTRNTSSTARQGLIMRCSSQESGSWNISGRAQAQFFFPTHYPRDTLRLYHNMLHHIHYKQTWNIDSFETVNGSEREIGEFEPRSNVHFRTNMLGQYIESIYSPPLTQSLTAEQPSLFSIGWHPVYEKRQLRIKKKKRLMCHWAVEALQLW